MQTRTIKIKAIYVR